MKSGVKYEKISINLNDPARDARHLKRYVFSKALYVESKFLFSFDPDRFLSFLCKTKPSCEINLVLHKCVFFRFKLFPRQVIFYLMCRKKEIQFFSRLGLNATKRLWFNANIQMFSAFSSITVNLHSKNFVFQCKYLFYVGTNYLVLLQLLFLYTSAIFTSNYGIISSYVDCTGSFLGCSVRGRKVINNSSKFLRNLISTEIC